MYIYITKGIRYYGVARHKSRERPSELSLETGGSGGPEACRRALQGKGNVFKRDSGWRAAARCVVVAAASTAAAAAGERASVGV